eukprot:4331324-Amphidinium_carterae.1
MSTAETVQREESLCFLVVVTHGRACFMKDVESSTRLPEVPLAVDSLLISVRIIAGRFRASSDHEWMD